MIDRIRRAYARDGLSGVLEALQRRLRRRKATSTARIRALVEGREGIEIGGPSQIFGRGGQLPLYPVVGSVDQCNFAAETMWDDVPASGPEAPPRGERFVAEGGDLSGIPSERYGFLLSSHMLEHTANPLRALAEWLRVLRPGGVVVLVLPHRDGTFDHRRPVTTIEHLREDHARGTGEDDSTHVEEILTFHDVSRDPGLRDIEELRERAGQNLRLRSLHHHVFDTALAFAAVREAGFVPLILEPLRPYHIIVAAAKPPLGGEAPLTVPEVERLLSASPFPTDRAAHPV